MKHKSFDPFSGKARVTVKGFISFALKRKPPAGL